MIELPKSGYRSRMKIYLAEMYPIPKNLAVSVLLYLSLAVFMNKVHRIHVPLFSGYFVIGFWSLLAVTLLTRLMDELKDKEIDLELFKDRPLPSGRVHEVDIRFSITAVIVLYFAANLWSRPTLATALLILGYSWLAFKRFFAARLLRESLLLTLATHNLLVPMVYLNQVALFSVQAGLKIKDLDWHYVLCLIFMYWTMSFAWEIARKIRSPEEETGYVTYSQIFSPTGAVLVAGGAQTISFAIGLYLYRHLAVPPLSLMILAVGYGTVVWSYARFIFSPSPSTSNLRPVAEIFILCVLVSQIIDRGLLPVLFGGLLD